MGRRGARARWPQAYMLEVQTRGGEHQLVKFRLVYDWLLHCHLVSMVTVVRALVQRPVLMAAPPWPPKGSTPCPPKGTN
eukprot:1848624-Prymnesium_polylepis.1